MAATVAWTKTKSNGLLVVVLDYRDEAWTLHGVVPLATPDLDVEYDSPIRVTLRGSDHDGDAEPELLVRFRWAQVCAGAGTIEATDLAMVDVLPEMRLMLRTLIHRENSESPDRLRGKLIFGDRNGDGHDDLAIRHSATEYDPESDRDVERRAYESLFHWKASSDRYSPASTNPRLPWTCRSGDEE